MKVLLAAALLATLASAATLHALPREETPFPSIQSFGVLPNNDPETNRERLQAAIDRASASGGALWVEPVEGGYPVASGLVLKKNVSLIGAHGPTGRGTRHPQRAEPTGSLFVIDDTRAPFITVESATQIRGLQFYYPKQAHDDPAKIVVYPPTIQVSHTQNAQGVTLANLTFYGETFAMDFAAPASHPCEQILIEHCYGYPLSGQFVRIERCYDVPRVLHCHVNPANMREFGKPFGKKIVNAVIAQKSYAYWIDYTDNAQLAGVFAFGVYGGAYLGAASYGQLTHFNFDCVAVGVRKFGDNAFNRNWQIAQGSIIANAGDDPREVHPFLIDGKGHTAIANVEAFSGGNAALDSFGRSHDYLCVRGNERLTVSVFGARMRNYAADSPFTIENPNAIVQAVGCIDKDEMPYSLQTAPARRAKMN